MQQYKWYSNTHEEISELAVASMPPFFRELVLDPIRRGYFVLGVIAPDKLFCDFTNHYFNCTPTKSGRHYGKVHEKVKREVKLIRDMLDRAKALIDPRYYLLVNINSQNFCPAKTKLANNA